MELINLTPHVITIVNGQNQPILYLTTSGQARIVSHRVVVDTILVNGTSVPIHHAQTDEITGLFEPRPNTYYVVSRQVAEAARGRTDLLVVDETVRDEHNSIIGCRAFARL